MLLLSEVGFLDSSGLSERLSRQAADARGRLVLAGIPPMMRPTLSLAGADTMFLMQARSPTPARLGID
ncbi:STAS domain-containing protein [Streptomyces sp. CG1]|uniref:STAS domain-containing protein n=1 Tax=Streptomyces sp. CG1 TaxID=1287523 RepID=UPI0034E221DC